MRKGKQLVGALARDETGATSIEYGLIAALVAVSAISAMGSLGNALSNTFAGVGNKMVSAQSGKL